MVYNAIIMTISLLIAILMSLSAAHPDVRIEWQGQFVEPAVIINDLKVMQENETEQKPVEETSGAEASVETSDEAKPEVPAEENTSEEGGLKAPDQGVEAVNA